ncbi:putative adhesin, partial [Pseudomonas syringae]|uniref:putative adhesin n=1 Tax=Pseudomonas syringae TaxID=317 RepID=UPI003AF35C45
NRVLRFVPAPPPRPPHPLYNWGGAPRAPPPPASILRPWTDALHNPDTRQAMHHSLCEKRLEDTPFAFLHQLLKQNALEDAEDQIVTSAQVSLADWAERLQHLQRLLIPMSLLLTPAFIASLATEVGIASLAIAATQLPGSRYAEKNQALLATLSLGLLQLTPHTPRLLRSLGRIIKPAARNTQNTAVAINRALSSQPLRRHFVTPRQTRLEKFFHTDALLKRWTLNAAASSNLLPIHAWKLGQKFLLWTSDRGQARTLVVSTHGYYTPWTGTVKIPNGTEIRTYAPHGYELVDPKLHRVVNKNARPFARSDTAVHAAMHPTPLEPLQITDKLIAGTSLPGRLKNYSLSKFQTTTDETYNEIARVVSHSRASPLRGWLPPTPMDVLTVRNRFGMLPPSLADLFDSLSVQGIHYDRILLVHCRCAAISALLSRAPVYHAPTAGSVITGIA